MNYEDMSDFDIAVELKNYVKGSFSVYADHRMPFVLCEDTNEEFDPCNNPDDMWPIIVDSEIAIIPPVSNGTNGWKAERFYPQNCGKIIEAIDANPLRAAAIVFLMMKDAENAQ